MTFSAGDKAILRLVAEKRGITGKKVFQKLSYFLQEAERVPLGVRFRMHYYGPFSDDLDSRMADLAAQRVLALRELVDGTVEISPGPQISSALVGEEPYREQVERVVKKLGRKGGLTLELLATAHYLGMLQGYTGSMSDRDTLVERVRAWKGSKYQPAFIRRGIDNLEAMGYLPSSS
jgi:uncharacterized protein YwgA